MQVPCERAGRGRWACRALPTALHAAHCTLHFFQDAGGQAVREQLEKLIGEMVDKGILFVDAQREFEKRFIMRILARCDGNVSRAAEALGMHRNTLSRKMTELRLKKRS